MPLVSQAVRYHYRLYGLLVETNRGFSGLTPVHNASQPDITIQLVERHALSEDFPNLRRGSWNQLALLSYLRLTSAGFSLFTDKAQIDQPLIGLRVPAGAEFVYTRDARRIWATWGQFISSEFAFSLLLNVGMAFNLRLRGLVCLHASGVVVNGGAVLFLGASGKGKSTLASLFGLHGHPILTDDIAAIRHDADHIWVSPGYPALRLYPESLPVSDVARRVSPIAPDWDKLFLHLDVSDFHFAQHPAPLSRIYVLADRDDQPLIESLSVLKALPLLVENNYLAPVSQHQDYQHDFAVLAEVAKRVPVRGLVVPNGIDKLPRLYDIVMSDLT